MTPTLNIVGAGHVGRVLGRLFAARGVFALQDVLTRGSASAQEALAFMGAGHAAAGGPWSGAYGPRRVAGAGACGAGDRPAPAAAFRQ